MLKRFVVLVGVVALIAAACGGSPEPRVFGEDDGKKKQQNRSSPPAHDNFASAEEFSSAPAEDATSTAAATVESGEPRLCNNLDKTVWYRVTPSRNAHLVAKASGDFQTVIAVYEGTDMAGLTEVGCSGPGTEVSLSFAARRGETYNIQVGGANSEGGSVDLAIEQASKAALLIGPPGPLPSNWVEEVLVEETEVSVPAVGPVSVPLLIVDGRPRASDPNFYDINLTVAGQSLPTIGLKTDGALQEEVHYELVRIMKEATTVKLQLSYRYDPNQADCRLDVGGTCVVELPLNVTDLEWTAEDGPSAELIVKAGVKGGKVDLNGQEVDLGHHDPLFVRIPLLGQVLTLLP